MGNVAIRIKGLLAMLAMLAEVNRVTSPALLVVLENRWADGTYFPIIVAHG